MRTDPHSRDSPPWGVGAAIALTPRDALGVIGVKGDHEHETHILACHAMESSFFGRSESREKEAPVQALAQGQRRDDSGAMRDSCLGLDAGGVKIAA